MPSDNGNDTPSRLDRIEKALELFVLDHEQFRDEHKKLLAAQVLLTEAQKRTDERLAELAEAQTALIHIVDDMVRNRPSQ